MSFLPVAAGVLKLNSNWLKRISKAAGVLKLNSYWLKRISKAAAEDYLQCE
jgi:hypothetical protein